MSCCPAEPDPAVNDRRRFIITPFVYHKAHLLAKKVD